MGHYATPEDAYWAFFDQFNANSADGWAGVMSYPHVRVSPPRGGATPRTASRVFATAADYAAQAAATFERIRATGWVRTEGIEPERVHTSEDRVHLAGGWTRYDAAGEPILTNRVTYVMTRPGEGWGIQARFGIDTWDEDADTSEPERLALAVDRRAIDAAAAGDDEALQDALAFPVTHVQVGDVTIERAEDFTSRRVPSRLESEARVVQAGARAVNLAVELRGDGLAVDELLLIVEQDGTWGISATSLIAR